MYWLLKYGFLGVKTDLYKWHFTKYAFELFCFVASNYFALKKIIRLTNQGQASLALNLENKTS